MHSNPSVQRKLRKHQAVCAQSPGADFIAEISQNLLIEQLMAHCKNTGLGQADKPLKGVLLYAQSNELLPALSQLGIDFDQIPILASKIPALQYPFLLSNLAMDWQDASHFIHTIQPLMAAEGQCWFSLYGALTANHARSILAELDPNPHFNAFYNLQDIGDALLGAGFRDVVVESNRYTLDYVRSETLIADAGKIFGVNLHADRRTNISAKGLKRAFIGRIDSIILAEGKYTEEIEILIAHARKGANVGLSTQFPVSVT